MRISDWSSDVCSSDLILSRLEDDLRHRLRFLDVQADDLVGRPGEQDLADLKVEGLLGIAAEKLTATIAAGGTEAILARSAMERLSVESPWGRQRSGSTWSRAGAPNTPTFRTGKSSGRDRAGAYGCRVGGRGTSN